MKMKIYPVRRWHWGGHLETICFCARRIDAEEMILTFCEEQLYEDYIYACYNLLPSELPPYLHRALETCDYILGDSIEVF